MKKAVFTLLLSFVLLAGLLPVVEGRAAVAADGVRTIEIDFGNEQDLERFLPVFALDEVAPGKVESLDAHWRKNGDSITRVNDNGEEVDSANSQASLFLNDVLVKYFEIETELKIGDIQGLAGIIFGGWNLNPRFAQGAEIFYLSKDRKVGFWGSHLRGPGGNLESGVIPSLSATDYNRIKLRVTKGLLEVFVDDVSVFDVKVPENRIFEGRVGIYTTKMDATFRSFKLTQLDEAGNPVDVAERTTVTSVAFAEDELSKQLSEGKFRLNYAVSPANAANREVSFNVVNSAVASVSTSGEVNLLGEGVTEILIYTKDGYFSDSLLLQVTEPEVVMTGLRLSKESVTLRMGESDGLIAIVTPDILEDYSISWRSSDTTVVMVANGKLTPVAPGTATITVRDDTRTFTATCEVTVLAADGNGGGGCNRAASACLAGLGLAVLAAFKRAVR